MARLIYSAVTSLDGYTADADRRFEWAPPDEEEHRFGSGTVYLCYRPTQEGGADPC